MQKGSVALSEKVVIIDNGTGFTKMGWAGNPQPTYDIPTIIADHVDKVIWVS